MAKGEIVGAVNRGKQFEDVVKECILRVPDVDVQRLYDSTNGFSGIVQPSDFIVYKYPHQYYLECKAFHGNTIHSSYITQLPALVKKSKVNGALGAVMMWFIDWDTTILVPAFTLRDHFIFHKSVNIREVNNDELAQSGKFFHVLGDKKRVYFDYDMIDLFKEVESWLGE